MKSALLLLGIGALLLLAWFRERREAKHVVAVDALLTSRIRAERRKNERFLRDLLVPPMVRAERERYLRSVAVEVCPLGVFVPLTDPRDVAEYVAVAPCFGARERTT